MVAQPPVTLLLLQLLLMPQQLRSCSTQQPTKTRQPSVYAAASVCTVSQPSSITAAAAAAKP